MKRFVLIYEVRRRELEAETHCEVFSSYERLEWKLAYLARHFMDQSQVLFAGEATDGDSTNMALHQFEEMRSQLEGGKA